MPKKQQPRMGRKDTSNRERRKGRKEKPLPNTRVPHQFQTYSILRLLVIGSWGKKVGRNNNDVRKVLIRTQGRPQ